MLFQIDFRKKLILFHPYLLYVGDLCDDYFYVEPLNKVQVAKEVVHFESRPWAYWVASRLIWKMLMMMIIKYQWYYSQKSEIPRMQNITS